MTNSKLNICKSKVYILLCFIFCFIFGRNFSQTISFLEDYQTESKKTIENKVNVLSEKSNYKWLNILPNVSYNLNPIDGNSYVSVGISLSNITRYYNQKQSSKIQTEILKSRLEEKLNNKLVSLENQYLKILNEIDILKSEIENLQQYKKIHEIQIEKFNNNKINLEAFIQEKIKYNSEVNKVFSHSKDIERKISIYNKKIKGSNVTAFEPFLALSQNLEILVKTKK